jgi:hypothetical protein
MTTSGTFTFNPAISDIILNAFSRCGKSGSELTAEHLYQANLECNLLNVEWANKGYNLWKQETIQVPPSAQLTPGIFQYAMPATTLWLTLAWIQTGTGTTNPIDLVMGPLSAIEYKAITNKLFQGRPTTFWYDRQITPLINLWPVPDSSQPYTLFCIAYFQLQDAVIPGGVTLDVPWRFLDAFTAGLAKRLAVHYAPERLGQAGRPVMGIRGTGLIGEAEDAWNAATTQDTENRPLVLMPDLSPYYRP